MRRTRSASSLFLWSTRVLVRVRSLAAGNGMASNRPLITTLRTQPKQKGFQQVPRSKRMAPPTRPLSDIGGASTMGKREIPNGSVNRDRNLQGERNFRHAGAETGRVAHCRRRRRLLRVQLLDGFRE